MTTHALTRLRQALQQQQPEGLLPLQLLDKALLSHTSVTHQSFPSFFAPTATGPLALVQDF